MRPYLQHFRITGGVVFGGMLVGCALAPVVPNAGSPATPQVVAAPEPSVAPSVVPLIPDVSCDPETTPWTVIDWPLRGQKARDWVLLGRCDDRLIQRVGRSPEPLRFRLENFHIAWLAPDASYALGRSHPTPASRDVPLQLIKRFADGRPDQVLHTEFVSDFLVSPDGKTIAFSTQGAKVSDPPEPSSDLNLMSTETGEVRKVATSYINSWTQWSPDGERLLFMRRHPDALNGDPRSVGHPFYSIAWTSWDEPTTHRMLGGNAARYTSPRRLLTWAPDSRHALFFDWDMQVPTQRANLVTLDFAGKEVSQPIVGPDGKPVLNFGPIDIAADNRLMVGYNALLDAETGRVVPLKIEGVLRWSLEPGKLLRWRMTPEGPVLDTVGLNDVAR